MQEEIKNTYIHKLANLTYGIIFSIGLIALAGYWGLDTFGYVDGLNLLSTTVTTIFISLALGGLLSVTFNFIPFLESIK